MIESELRERRFAPIVRLEVDSNMSALHRGMLAAELGLPTLRFANMVWMPGGGGGCAAIANAVHNATGVRMKELPLTPDRVLAALLAAGEVSPRGSEDVARSRSPL